VQTYISVGFTVFTIFFLIHILTCFFYMCGTGEQVLPNNVTIPGWVQNEEGCLGECEATWDDTIQLETRYITSM
jgi:hypothetical protein